MDFSGWRNCRVSEAADRVCKEQFKGVVQRKKAEDSFSTLYGKYASGEIIQDEYRRSTDETEDEKSALSEQIRACQEKLGHLKEDQEKLGEDMRQIIRCSHMETLTQELADIFIKIYMYTKISGWKLNCILRRAAYENDESISGHIGNQLS